MPVPSGWWYHLSVIEPTRQVLVANHWTVPLSRIPNSSYTQYKLDHNHDPYPTPSLVYIHGGKLIRDFHSARPHLRHWVNRASSLNLEHMVASHCYYPGKPSSPIVEVQHHNLSISQHKCFHSQSWINIHLSHPAHGSIQNQPIFIIIHSHSGSQQNSTSTFKIIKFMKSAFKP